MRKPSLPAGQHGQLSWPRVARCAGGSASGSSRLSHHLLPAARAILAGRWAAGQLTAEFWSARQVKAWVDQTVWPRHFKGNHAKRFHLAIAQERMRLHDAFDPLI